MTSGVRYRVAHDVHCRRFHEELVVLDLSRGDYFALDEVGSRVWEGLSQGRPLDDIVAGLAALYDTDVTRLEQDVAEFAAELVRRNLMVEERAGLQGDPAGRRI